LSYSEDGFPPAGSIGKVTADNKVKLVDPLTLGPAPPGEPGELLVNTNYAENRYWNKPEETAECFLNIDGEGWYRTGDIIRIGDGNWLYFMDRSVDMIKHKGYRIAAAEIEKVLQEHPTVLSSCVVGIPDEKVGERIKAFVVLKGDIKAADGYWLVEVPPDGRGSVITYSTFLDTGKFVPEFVVQYLQKKSLGGLVENVRKRILSKGEWQCPEYLEKKRTRLDSEN
jgi:acyl-CoA synthetase (AMP-forming)/AMP-acid ligase II